MSLEKNLHIFFGKKKQFCILVFFFLYFSLFRVCGVLCCWWCLTSPLGIPYPLLIFSLTSTHPDLQKNDDDEVTHSAFTHGDVIVPVTSTGHWAPVVGKFHSPIQKKTPHKFVNGAGMWWHKKKLNCIFFFFSARFACFLFSGFLFFLLFRFCCQTHTHNTTHKHTQTN